MHLHFMIDVCLDLEACRAIPVLQASTSDTSLSMSWIYPELACPAQENILFSKAPLERKWLTTAPQIKHSCTKLAWMMKQGGGDRNYTLITTEKATSHRDTWME